MADQTKYKGLRRIIDVIRDVGSDLGIADDVSVDTELTDSSVVNVTQPVTLTLNTDSEAEETYWIKNSSNGDVTVVGDDIDDLTSISLAPGESVCVVRNESNTGWVIVSSYSGRRDNLTATAEPTTDDDETKGYGVWSRWIDTLTQSIYVCTNAAAGAAVWVQLGAIAAAVGVNILSGASISLQSNSFYESASIILEGGSAA